MPVLANTQEQILSRIKDDIFDWRLGEPVTMLAKCIPIHDLIVVIQIVHRDNPVDSAHDDAIRQAGMPLNCRRVVYEGGLPLRLSLVVDEEVMI